MLLYSAPMAGYTHYAYRELLRQFGSVDLIFTEMVSARSFSELEKRGETPPSRLWGIRDEPRPLAVQIWDNDPDTLANLAHSLAFDYNVSSIDLNFGCPARQIAGKSESGSYLLQFPSRIGDIVRHVVAAAAPVPVTAKIRLGRTRDTINAVDVAQAVEEAGASGITIHGRTAADGYRGLADWEAIAKVKSKLRSILLIGNGDIQTVEEAVFRINHFPVDGIMIGRGGIAKPWLFRQIACNLRGKPAADEPNARQISDMICRLFSALQRQFPPHAALMLCRKMVCHYAAGLAGARKFRNDVCTAQNEQAFLEAVQFFFAGASNE